MKKFIKYTGIVITGIFVIIGAGSTSVEAASCNFTSTLSEGSEGEDVRCLQRFLNEEGYIIATSGAGSPGKETDTFKTLTDKAVKRWQAGNGLTADGYFGPSSQAKYKNLISQPQANTVPSTSSAEVALLEANLAKAEAALDNLKSSGTTSFSSDIKDAANDLVGLEKDLDKAEDDGVDIEDAQDEYFFALKKFVLAIKGTLSGNTTESTRQINNVKESIIDAERIIRDETENEGDLEETLEDLDDELDDLEDEIEDKEDDGDDVDDAEDLLDDARDLLEEAEEEFEDTDYEDVRDVLHDLDDVLDDLYKELDLGRAGTKDAAKDAIDDAEDAIDDARDEIEDAQDDGDDVDKAEDLLEEAEEALEDAEDEYDDKDYKKAQKLAEEAEELAEEAEDEL